MRGRHGVPGAGYYHPDQDRQRRRRHMAGADHSAGGGRCDSGGAAALRSKFARAKNTAQGRGAIRAQTIVELEKKKSAQIIEDYGEVTVTASADDPTVCLVEFGFAVAHGLNQIYLTVHLTV